MVEHRTKKKPSGRVPSAAYFRRRCPFSSFSALQSRTRGKRNGLPELEDVCYMPMQSEISDNVGPIVMTTHLI